MPASCYNSPPLSSAVSLHLPPPICQFTLVLQCLTVKGASEFTAVYNGDRNKS